MIDRLAAEGCGILLICSEIEEAMAMCDRILVMAEGDHRRHVRPRGLRRGDDRPRSLPLRGCGVSRPALAALMLRWLPLAVFLVVLLYFGVQAPRFLGASRSPTSSSRRASPGSSPSA